MERNGLLVIDKPAGWTSHDVVARLRRVLGEKSIGHLGTLDPMATGVLPLVLGRMTRLAQFYGGAEKTYEGSIRFGNATTTYDAEGERLPADDPAEVAEFVSQLTIEKIRTAAARFRGEIEQTPPPFSAKKIGGVPAYKLARKQKPIELKAVPITVHSFELEEFDGECVRFQIEVSSGTYIRSIAHELGAALGTGAHLASLRRTRVGDFTLADAHTLEEVEQACASETSAGARKDQNIGHTVSATKAGPVAEALFVHPRRILSFMPSVTASPEAVSYLRNGRSVNLPEFSDAPHVKVFGGQSDLIAICQRLAGTLFKPKVVLWGSNQPTT